MSRRVAFLGTPEVAVPALETLVDDERLDVVAVVTNPDRPRGRGRAPQAPPVKEAAERLGVRVLQPRRPVEIVDDLRDLDLDAAAIVAYGAILPREVLDTAANGFVNLHFSLLPRWRGAAPVQHAIAAGDERTGVTTFVLDEGMDTGPIVEQVEVDIVPGETAGELLDRLADLGAPILADSVAAVAAGEAAPAPQSDDGATLAPKIDTGDARIDWTAPAAAVANLVRAVNPSPGAHTTWEGDRFKVWEAGAAGAHPEAEPGIIVNVDGDGPVVATGDGAVRLLVVQPAGKARMDAASWINGYRPEVGQRFGTG